MEEDVQIREYDWKLMRRLLLYLKPYRFSVILGIVLMIAFAGLQTLTPYLVKVAIDEYIANDTHGLNVTPVAGFHILSPYPMKTATVERITQQNLHGLTLLAGLYLLILIAAMLIQYLQVFVMQITGQKVMIDMRMQIFTHLQRLELNFFQKHPVGRLMTRVTNDVDVLNELFTSGVVSIFGDVLSLTGYIIAMMFINFRLAIVTLSVVPLLFLTTVVFRRKARAAYSETRYWLAKMNAFLQEAISGMSIIQVFNQEKRMYDKFDGINHKHYEANQKSVMAYAVFYPVVEFIEALAIAILVWYGGNRAIAGFVTFGALIAFIQYTQRFFRPIADLSEKYNIIQSAMASSEKIFNLIDSREMIELPSNGFAPGRLSEVEFRNVSFRYPKGEQVLRNVSFKIAAGEKLAIVGPTGAGKTTVTGLLLRFYDGYEGQILINGVDLREIPEEQVRRDFAVVFQDAFLFSRTVKENISFDRPEIGEQQIRSVATELLADPFIRQLPNGYEQLLSERGSNLSFGQRQLLTFVRAIASNPSLIVLDEATSSVDVETEYVIRHALKKLMENRTAVLIAHRLSTIQNVDRILVLFDGKVREEGTHQELLAREDLYYKLYQLQYKEQAVEA